MIFRWGLLSQIFAVKCKTCTLLCIKIYLNKCLHVRETFVSLSIKQHYYSPCLFWLYLQVVYFLSFFWGGWCLSSFHFPFFSQRNQDDSNVGDIFVCQFEWFKPVPSQNKLISVTDPLLDLNSVCECLSNSLRTVGNEDFIQCHTQTLDNWHKRSVTLLKDRISFRFHRWAQIYGIATRYVKKGPVLARKFLLLSLQSCG